MQVACHQPHLCQHIGITIYFLGDSLPQITFFKKAAIIVEILDLFLDRNVELFIITVC